MSIWIWIVIIIFILILFYFLYQFLSKNNLESREILPKEAKRLIKDNYFDYIIDVRTNEEWNKGHYPDAIHIGMERLIFDLPKKVPDIISKILFYCAKGRRAKGASVIAETLGYKNTRYLKGTYTDL